MRELILAAVALVLQLAVFYCTGSLLMHVFKGKKDASLELIVGYLAYYAVFEALAVPMTLALVPLSVLTIVWAVIMVLVVVCAAALLHRTWADRLKRIGGVWRNHSWWIVLLLAVIGLQCLIVCALQDYAQDAAYYVGTVSTSVYTDTLGRFDPFTGAALTKFQARYILSAFPMSNAVWCKLLGLPALIQCKIVMACINVLEANLVMYQIGKKLFHGGRKQADLMVGFVCLLNLFSGTIYTQGEFLLTRAYEGKSMLANIAIPAAFFLALCLWQMWNEDEAVISGKTRQISEKKHLLPVRERNVWCMLFAAGASAICFSGSAVIFPVAVSAGVLPLILVKRKWNRLIPYALCMLPGILHAGVYLCASMKIITLWAS